MPPPQPDAPAPSPFTDVPALASRLILRHYVAVMLFIFGVHAVIYLGFVEVWPPTGDGVAWSGSAVVLFAVWMNHRALRLKAPKVVAHPLRAVSIAWASVGTVLVAYCLLFTRSELSRVDVFGLVLAAALSTATATYLHPVVALIPDMMRQDLSKA